MTTCFQTRKYVRCAAAFLVVAVFLTLTTACSIITSSLNGNPQSTHDPTNSDGSTTPSMDLDSEMNTISRTPAVPIVLSPVASGSKVEANDLAVIDFSNTPDGYVMVKWIGDRDKDLRVQVLGPTGITYTYTLKADAEFEVYPLSDGNGTYTARALELVEDGRGAVIVSATFDVTLIDEFAPFLRPNQFVNFYEGSLVVTKAAELVAQEYDFLEKISAIYNFVITEFTYDVDLANEIIAGMHPHYLPVLDTVYAKRMGICFDFASLMSAMLRSQGIPTKLVVGTVEGDLSHAWINVFSEEEGWINAMIFFDGTNWQLMDPTFAASGDSPALRQFIGDATHYEALYLY